MDNYFVIGRPGKLHPTPVVNRYGCRAVRPRATAGARPRGPRGPPLELDSGPGAALVTARREAGGGRAAAAAAGAAAGAGACGARDGPKKLRCWLH